MTLTDPSPLLASTGTDGWHLQLAYGGPDGEMLLEHAAISPVEQELMDLASADWASSEDPSRQEMWKDLAREAAATPQEALFALSMAREACQIAAAWRDLTFPLDRNPMWTLWAAPISDAAVRDLTGAPIHPHGGQLIVNRVATWSATRGIPVAAVVAAAGIARSILRNEN